MSLNSYFSAIFIIIFFGPDLRKKANVKIRKFPVG